MNDDRDAVMLPLVSVAEQSQRNPIGQDTVALGCGYERFVPTARLKYIRALRSRLFDEQGSYFIS